jgi:hypothetical protein
VLQVGHLPQDQDSCHISSTVVVFLKKKE